MLGISDGFTDCLERLAHNCFPFSVLPQRGIMPPPPAPVLTPGRVASASTCFTHIKYRPKVGKSHSKNLTNRLWGQGGGRAKGGWEGTLKLLRITRYKLGEPPLGRSRFQIHTDLPRPAPFYGLFMHYSS
jgi:hypothetical protein